MSLIGWVIGKAAEKGTNSDIDKKYWLGVLDKFYMSACVVITGFTLLVMSANKNLDIYMLAGMVVGMWVIRSWVIWLFRTGDKLTPTANNENQALKELVFRFYDNLFTHIGSEHAKDAGDFIIDMIEHDPEIVVKVLNDINASFTAGREEGIFKLATYITVMGEKADEGELLPKQVELFAKYEIAILYVVDEAVSLKKSA